MQTVTLPSGERVPALGQGAWRMGENQAARAEEIATLRLGLDLDLTLIDTAEMYGEGRAEELIGEVIEGRREEVFLARFIRITRPARARWLPASAASNACALTLSIFILLHWRGRVPLPETMEGFMGLHQAGKIRYYGVSNFDRADMQELWSVPGGSGDRR